MVIQNKYLYLNEEKNALDYLERAGEFIKATPSDPMAWKWVIISLHGALYGFAISACKGSDDQSVVKITNNGYERLITLNEAITMCKNKRYMGALHGGLPLDLSNSQENSIRLLKTILRNSFEHYIPKGWSIEMHGLPRMSVDILDVIRFLAVETFRYQQLNQAQRRRIKSIVFQSKKLLKNSLLHLELVEIEDRNKL